MRSLDKFAGELFSQSLFSKFGIEVDCRPMEIEAKLLPKPTALIGKNYKQIDEFMLKKTAVQNPVTFAEGKWAFVFELKNEKVADNVYNTMI